MDTESVSNGTNPKRVLVVDDDGVVLSLLKVILEAGGYSVTAASGAEAATKCFSESSGVDLLVTDVKMPGKTGVQLAAELSLKQPALPVLFITGSGMPVKRIKGQPEPNVLAKPFDARSLLASVQQALNAG